MNGWGGLEKEGHPACRKGLHPVGQNPEVILVWFKGDLGVIWSHFWLGGGGGGSLVCEWQLVLFSNTSGPSPFHPEAPPLPLTFSAAVPQAAHLWDLGQQLAVLHWGGENNTSWLPNACFCVLMSMYRCVWQSSLHFPHDTALQKLWQTLGSVNSFLFVFV